MSSAYDQLVDSSYPGDLRLIGSLDNPLLAIGAISYSNSVNSTGVAIDITQRYRYSIQPLDGTQALDGNIYLSGYKQPRLP